MIQTCQEKNNAIRLTDSHKRFYITSVNNWKVCWRKKKMYCPSACQVPRFSFLTTCANHTFVVDFYHNLVHICSKLNKLTERERRIDGNVKNEEKVQGLFNPTGENRVAPANWLRIQKSTVKTAAMSWKVTMQVTAPAQICLRRELRCNLNCSVGSFPKNNEALFILCKDGATIHSRWRVRQWELLFPCAFLCYLVNNSSRPWPPSSVRSRPRSSFSFLMGSKETDTSARHEACLTCVVCLGGKKKRDKSNTPASHRNHQRSGTEMDGDWVGGSCLFYLMHYIDCTRLYVYSQWSKQLDTLLVYFFFTTTDFFNGFNYQEHLRRIIFARDTIKPVFPLQPLWKNSLLSQL